jgi:NAD(P)H-nitrite reductase large subunit
MHIVIIGNGITGITTARFLRKASPHRITVISAETEHFFARTALMYIYMGHMKYEHTKPYEDDFWQKNDIGLIHARVTRIDPGFSSLELDDGSSIRYDKLVVATGSKPAFYGWPGQDLPGVQGFYSFQDLELMEKSTNGIGHGVVVGGGLIGIEVAEMLRSRGIGVTFLVREPAYWNIVLPPEEAGLIDREIRSHGVDLRLSTQLRELVAGSDGRVARVITGSGEVIESRFVALTTGVRPNIDLASASGIDCNRGVLVNRYFETNMNDVYAAGDCAEFTEVPAGEASIEQLWYTGRKQGEALARVLLGERKAYDRGIWFNSAKFFDIEYQTYGTVPPELPGTENTFCWMHPEKRILFRMNFNKDDESVTGFNVLGMRLRQAVCEKWITGQEKAARVMENLGDAVFDPELYEHHEQDIVKHWNESNPGRAVKLRRRRGLRGLFQFRNLQKA